MSTQDTNHDMDKEKLYPWLKPQLEDFAQRLKDNTLHHAILCVDEPNGSGNALAVALSKKVLCLGTDNSQACNRCKSCMLFNAQSHPDFHEVSTEKTQIGVDAVRIAIEQVNKTAQLGGNKVVLIQDIERMSESASNALLKTLEEPTAHTFLVLSTHAVQYILATILSRCEKVRVTRPSYEQSIDYLREIGVAPSRLPTKDELAAYQHSPISFLAATDKNDGSSNTAANMSYAAFKQDFSELSSGSLSAEALARKWQDSAQEAVNWTSQLALLRLSQALQSTIDQNREVVGTNWMSLYDEATRAGKKLRQAGLNKVLILSALFSKVP
ncbi:hypothetical protein PN836_003425 [Ningiella sp. W23]|uniref:hypothetical protein n=1 Tax=Ningiella sp. W23 TaxID=3023715 RepID=UPI003758489B